MELILKALEDRDYSDGTVQPDFAIAKKKTKQNKRKNKTKQKYEQ